MLPSPRRVPSTLSTSVTHLEPASNEKQAPTCLSAAAYAAITELSAMHVQHERGSH